MYIFNPIPTMNQAQGVAQTCRVSPNFLVDPPPAMAAEKTQIMCDDSEVRRLQVGGPGRYFFRVDLYIYIHICIHIYYIYFFLSIYYAFLYKVHKKTQLCKFFAVGACTRGSNCAFAHGAAQLREQPDFSKTRLCADFIELLRVL